MILSSDLPLGRQNIFRLFWKKTDRFLGCRYSVTTALPSLATDFLLSNALPFSDFFRDCLSSNQKLTYIVFQVEVHRLFIQDTFVAWWAVTDG